MPEPNTGVGPWSSASEYKIRPLVFNCCSLSHTLQKEGYLTEGHSSMGHNKLRTYVHITGHYIPSVRIMDLVSHTTCVMCFNFIYMWRMTDFHGILFTQIFCQKSAERKSPKKFFLYFVFDVWPGARNPGSTPSKAIHYLLDYSEFFVSSFNQILRKIHS